MNISRVVEIKLEDSEIDALKTLEGARDQCICYDLFECQRCPLYVDDVCIGRYAKMVLEEHITNKKEK